MGVPQVSHQALLNEAAKHKTWESLEARLMDLIVSGQVLEYHNDGKRISVTLDGTTGPVYLEVNPNAPKPETKTEVSADSFEAAPEPKGGGTAVLTKQRAKKTTIPAPTASVAVPAAGIKAPVGVVALVGLRTEAYEAHARKLVRHALTMNAHFGDKLEDAVTKTLQSFWNVK